MMALTSFVSLSVTWHFHSFRIREQRTLCIGFG